MVVGACPQTLRVIEYLTGVLITSRERWDEEIKVEAEGAETPDYSNNNSQQSDHHQQQSSAACPDFRSRCGCCRSCNYAGSFIRRRRVDETGRGIRARANWRSFLYTIHVETYLYMKAEWQYLAIRC